MKNSLSSESLLPRLQAVEALAAIAHGQWPPHDLKTLAVALDAVSAAVSSAAAATAYNAFGGIVRIVDMLTHWRRAVLEAEPDADRYLRSARERYRLWLNDYDQSDAAAQLRAAVAGLATLESIEQVADIAHALTAVPLPVGIFAQPVKPDWAVQSELERKEEPLVDLTVAFLKFQFDGQPAAEVHQLAAREVHDLEIEVRVSRWPQDKRELRLTPISVEPKSTYDFPSFQFQKPDGDAPYTMRQSGRAALLLPQGMHARPFEFKYTAEFIPERGDQPVAVVGHRTLIVDGADASKLQVCGYPGLDQALYTLRDALRRRPGVPQSETADALIVLAALCNLAGRAVQDAEFKGRWDEAAFQRHVRAELRRQTVIGADLDEHAHAAGGITDLSLHGMPIELKAVDTLISSVDQCDPFLAQTASYAVAKSKRTAILCVLDSSEKKTAPVPPETLLGIRTHAKGAVSICVLVIQGHLARPSALSR
ncbi:hypothetical protein LYSHEL_21570 [Lysobacter helvus]|uniref:Restriction endonuclease n=2 Tax=Lysobacteraceae TaxID=32033 RepID=A0ABN6FVZ7_9GAMM|nr:MULTISPECIES: hypothetical protein [Lysobacter]BCT93134.1 hypothetical protein LYSCAS_21580 [Lysobacter caseinilyticus]BCT96286.1 hypothetical protein LYSHEL_21570 [Lysobacter helvus]